MDSGSPISSEVSRCKNEPSGAVWEQEGADLLRTGLWLGTEIILVYVSIFSTFNIHCPRKPLVKTVMSVLQSLRKSILDPWLFQYSAKCIFVLHKSQTFSFQAVLLLRLLWLFHPSVGCQVQFTCCLRRHSKRSQSFGTCLVGRTKDYFFLPLLIISSISSSSG